MFDPDYANLGIGVLLEWMRHAPSRRLKKLASQIGGEKGKRLQEEWLATIRDEPMWARWWFAIGIGRAIARDSAGLRRGGTDDPCLTHTADKDPEVAIAEGGLFCKEDWLAYRVFVATRDRDMRGEALDLLAEEYADVLRLLSSDLSVEQAREVIRSLYIVGSSVHGQLEALRSQAERAGKQTRDGD